MARAGKIDWRFTETRRKKFIQKLAETYDVEAALAFANLTWPQVCELRVRHPDFAARFEEVIAAGYDRVEAMLLRESGLGGGGGINLTLAQALLKQRRGIRAEGGAGAAKRGATRAVRSDAIKSIMGEFELLRAGQAAGRQSNGNGSGQRDTAGRAAGAR